MKTRTIDYSQLAMAVLMLPEHTNPYGNVHGGEIMKLMDNAAGVVAQRHTRTQVVTIRVDELEFIQPIRLGNLVTCHAKMTFVGRSSMEVAATVMVEDLTKDEPAKAALTAYFTFVSLDSQGKPQPAPALELVTEEECRLFETGRQRYMKYKQNATKAGQEGHQ
ncbi:MAG TPA: acyl-CoA thioesterase [Negativicutes bacterium]|nr:acyl-CoA thioesterase [Negativicutes bacterium]